MNFLTFTIKAHDLHPLERARWREWKGDRRGFHPLHDRLFNVAGYGLKYALKSKLKFYKNYQLGYQVIIPVVYLDCMERIPFLSLLNLAFVYVQQSIVGAYLVIRHRIKTVYSFAPPTTLPAIPLKYLFRLDLLQLLQAAWDDRIKVHQKCMFILQHFIPMHCANVVIANGFCMEKFARQLGVSRRKIIIAYSRLRDLDKAKNATRQGLRKLLNSDSAPVVLCVSRLIWLRQVGTVIGAMVGVVREIPDAKLAIAGYGALQANLSSLVSSLGLTNSVVFLGKVPHSEIWNVYAAADVVVVLSSHWGISLSLAEAAYMGKPIIGSRHEGTYEFIQNGVNGFLVSSQNIGELSDRIVEILKNKELAEQMGKRGKQFIKQTFLPLAKEISQVLEEARQRGLIR